MQKILLSIIFILANLNFSFCQISSELPYERFIGLGSCCVTRTQINHHLSKKFDKPISEFGGGQVFDWVIISDYNKLAEAIKYQLSDLFEKSDLAPSRYFETPHIYIKNIKYDMLWIHLFIRSNPTVDMQDLLDNTYLAKKQKIDYLVQKFKDLSEYRTLYIIAYPYEGDRLRLAIEPDLETLIHLKTALEELRGNANFSILFCPLEKKFDDFENIYVREIINGPGIHDYVGNYNHWDKLLSEFPFTLKKCDVDSQNWTNEMNW